MKPLFFLVGLVFLSGCTTTMTSADRARMKRIGVVSLMGDNVVASYISLMSLTHQHYEEPASGLGIDDIAEQEAASLLWPEGVPLPAERSVGRSTRFLGMRDLKISAADIAAAAQRQQLDGLVVVYPMLYHGKPANLEGVTLMGAFSYRNQVRPVLYAAANYYDGHTGRRLGTANIRTRQDSEPAVMPDGTPILWRKKYAAYPPEDREALRDAIRKEFRTCLAEALGRMGLRRPIGGGEPDRASRR